MAASRALVVMSEPQLIRTVKELIAKGDQAREKSEQFYVAAGQHLKTMKEGKTQADFLEIVKEKIGIGKTRTYELLQIADGRTTTTETGRVVSESNANAKKRDTAFKERSKAARQQSKDEDEEPEAKPTGTVSHLYDGLSKGSPPSGKKVRMKQCPACGGLGKVEVAEEF